jgi:hypothetical protein
MGALMTKYFVDDQGNYLGGFDGAAPPSGAIEVANPPCHGKDKWDGMNWIPHEPTAEPEAPGLAEQIIANPTELAKLKSALGL